MPIRDRQKQVKIFYLDPQQQWRDYAFATLQLDMVDSACTMRLALQSPLQPPQLALLPHAHLLNPLDNTLHIQLERISKIQRLDDFILALSLQEWNRVLSISFRDELYCDMIAEQIELNAAARSKLPCEEEQMINYVAQQMASNPFFVEMFFNTEEVIITFLKQAVALEDDPDQSKKKTLFRLVKQIFLRADKSTLKMLLADQYYELLLLCLSQFGDRRIAYHDEYRRTAHPANLLAITQPQILQKYQQNIRIRFLTNVATSMFIEPPAEALLNEILNENSLALLEFVVVHPEHLLQGKQLAESNPEAYLQLFAELWETFKSIMEDARTAVIKRAFKDTFISENMLNVTFTAVEVLTSQRRVNGRLYQQFLQALNPCLSHKWNESQELLLFLYEQKRTHILQLLLGILSVADYNTKSIVMLFARNMVEVTDNRPKMKQAFLNYFFNQFVSRCAVYFNSTEELEVLVQFNMRLYRMDLVRARRAIVEAKLLPQLQTRMDNKYVLILILKLLRFFLEFNNDGIFQYMTRHDLFKDLQRNYFYTKTYSPKGIVYSLYLGMLKDLLKTSNAAGLKYLHRVMCNQKTE